MFFSVLFLVTKKRGKKGGHASQWRWGFWRSASLLLSRSEEGGRGVGGAARAPVKSDSVELLRFFLFFSLDPDLTLRKSHIPSPSPSLPPLSLMLLLLRIPIQVLLLLLLLPECFEC